MQHVYILFITTPACVIYVIINVRRKEMEDDTNIPTFTTFEHGHRLLLISHPQKILHFESELIYYNLHIILSYTILQCFKRLG